MGARSLPADTDPNVLTPDIGSSGKQPIRRASLARDVARRMRLRDGAREAVQHESVAGAVERAEDQAEHQIVRDEITVSHDRPYLLAERRAEPLLFPQQVTGGDVRHAQVVGEPGP